MTLRPPEGTQKALLSTTSQFTGEFERDGFLLSHAWSDGSSPAAIARQQEGPHSRNAFVFVFKASKKADDPAFLIPDYSNVPESMANLLSVFFGKRFDSHGLIESSGLFRLPTLDQFRDPCLHGSPFNSHTIRRDFPIPLNLSEVARLDPAFTGRDVDVSALRAFYACAKFYSLALRAAERDAEVAYLHLITALEILSSTANYEKQQLLDAQSKALVSAIERSSSDGPALAKKVLSRLLQVKRRFVRAILDHTDPSFFKVTESLDQFGALKSESYEKAVAAAYDLRSLYVHSGTSFGRLVSYTSGYRNYEVQAGKPVVEGKKFADAIAAAPTFLGLERITRHCLLHFAEAQAFIRRAGDA